VFERTHENRLCFALFSRLARAALLAGIAKIATGKTCTTAKHLFTWDWSVFKCWDTNVVFQTAIFWSYEITKGPQALTAKPATAFPEVAYITVALS